MQTTRKRVTLPFLFRAADALGANGKLIARAYGNEVEGVFARAGAAYMPAAGIFPNADTGLIPAYHDGGLVKVPHSLPRLTTIGGEAVLLLEGAATNLLLRSQEIDNAAWVNVGTPGVSADSLHAPDGSITGEYLTDNDGAETRGRRQTVAVANDSTIYCASVYVSKASAAPTANYPVLNLRFTGGSTVDAYVVLNPFTGATASNGGAVLKYGAEDCGHHWRLFVSAANNASGNTSCLVSIYPAGNNAFTAGTDVAGQGQALFWGAQLETGYVPTSYQVTTSASAARITDSLYFPFLLRPQEMTLYVRGVERMSAELTQVATTVLCGISDSSGADAKAYFRRPASSNGYRFVHDPSTATESASVGTAATRNDVVELRGVIGADGSATLGVSVNGAAEATSGPSTAQPLLFTWSGERLYLNSLGSNNPGNFAPSHVAVALGTKTLAEMRALAEVG